jgi:hypothetical protein
MPAAKEDEDTKVAEVLRGSVSKEDRKGFTRVAGG